jgi:hypothetical protein
MKRNETFQKNASLKRINISFFIVLAALLSSCASAAKLPERDFQSSITVTPIAQEDYSHLGLTTVQINTLLSLERVDDYPLYTMRYEGSYPDIAILDESIRSDKSIAVDILWGCSLFTTLGDPNNILYGRNFDWGYSPALLLFTDPPFGYASASMVDIAFLGYRIEDYSNLMERPVQTRLPLLRSPSLPFDGINEKGLVVGMAAVPGSNPVPDDSKPTIGSLGMIRVLLDHAANVDEAVTLMRKYNIDFGDEPTIHYLIADASGHSVLVEYYHSEMYVTYNQSPWHLATNFTLATAGDNPEDRCSRYDTIQDRLTETQGILDTMEALQLLQLISKENTQWSIVYDSSHREVQVVMGREYDVVLKFHLE